MKTNFDCEQAFFELITNLQEIKEKFFLLTTSLDSRFKCIHSVKQLDVNKNLNQKSSLLH